MCFSGDGIEPIAIIGLSFKFAGDAVDSKTFWQMITEGRCAAAHVPEHRFNVDNFYHPDTNRLRTLPTRDGYFLKDDIAAFDAPFFSITAAEAAAMDPQSRILLETSYRALENAGIPIEKCAGTDTSVYIGCSSEDYKSIYLKDPERPIRHAATGMAYNMLANKISWFYDVTGPSITLDTACSASLNALHLGCESLRSGDSSMGLVGGINIFFTPETMSPLAHLNFFSPDGRCYSFDHRANGYARGEGFGVVVIKRLTDALAGGDTIRAVIRATGSNENGRTTGGITQVNAAAQESLIRKTYQKARLDFSETRYVEAHGPGTGGDIVEAAALASVFADFRSDDDPLYLGSCKANVGHLEGGSGIAGLIKTILILEHGIIPQLANFERLSPGIPAERYHFKYPTENTVWPPGLRRASINSFGFGGSNAHVIIEDAYHHLERNHVRGNHCTIIAPKLDVNGHATTIKPYTNGDTQSLDRNDTPPSSYLLVFSSSDESSLERNLQSFATYSAKLESSQNDKSYLRNLAYTLAKRRSQHPWRLALVAESLADLVKPTPIARQRTLRHATIGYVFTGQGAQYAKMGLALMKYNVFQTSLQKCELALQSFGCTWLVIDELSKAAEGSNIQKAEYSQALTTALQVALVDLLQSFGVLPSAVLGHSSGEIAAAYCCGALSLVEACKIAYFRGIYSTRTADADKPRGMMAVGLGMEQADLYLRNMRIKDSNLNLTVACINSPTNVTISGLAQNLRALKVELDKQSIFAQILKVDVAYHSPYMAIIADDYRAAIGDIEDKIGMPSIKFYSTSTAQSISHHELQSADYWTNNLLSQVQFALAMTKLCQSKSENGITPSTNPNIIIEIGPHSALRSPIKQTISNFPEPSSISYHSTQMRNADGYNTFLQLLGSLYCTGYPVSFDTSSHFGDSPTCLADLPEYSFNHSRTYWHESRLSKNFRFRDYPALDLLGTRVPDWNSLDARWRNIITTLENPWIADHQINGTLLYPGAGQLVMAIEASAQLARDMDDRQPAGFCLKDVEFIKSLNISLDSEGVEAQISLRPLRNAADRTVGWSEFKVCIYENEEWVETCHGRIMVEYNEPENEIDKGRERSERVFQLQERYQRISSRCQIEVSKEKVYRRLNDYGLELGPTFKVFGEIRHNDENEAVAQVKLRQWVLRGNPLHSSPHFIHPTALDGVLQLGIAALSNCGNDNVPTMVPSRINRLWMTADGLSGEDVAPLKGCAKSEYRGYRHTHMDILALDHAAERPRIVVEGLETIIIGSRSSNQASECRLCYKMTWIPITVQDIHCNGFIESSSHPLQDVGNVTIISSQNLIQREIAANLMRLLLSSKEISCPFVSITSLKEATQLSTLTNTVYIFLLDLNQFYLSQMDEISFSAIKGIVSRAKSVLWAYPNPQCSGHPTGQISGDIQGLARTLRTEYDELRFVSLGLEANSSTQAIALSITDVLKRTVGSEDHTYEPEYLQMNGALFVSRLVEDRELNKTISKHSLGKQQEVREFGSHPALKLGIGTPGLLDTLQFEQDHTITSPLLPYEIEVKPKFCGLNFMDCLVALGRVPHTSLGVEGSGIVLRAGTDSDLMPGDNVILCASGTVKSVIRCHYNTAVKIPDSMPLQEAAALPATAATVYHALYNIARLRAGETILIHAGAGATGQMAIQMSLNLGAIVFVTVGSANKRLLVMKQYGVPERHIFYSRNKDFASGIRRITNGRGVDVVLNSLAGDSLVASWECIAAFGRFIEIGKRDIYSHKQLPMFPFAKNVTFSAIDLAGIWQDLPALMRQLLSAVVEMANKKEINVATPLNVYPISKVETAFRLLQSGKSAGKVVLEMNDDDQVPTCLEIQPEYNFHEQSTYVISGGLGGLGKSAAKWLVRRGAKHLLLLSRSGPKTDDDLAFIRSLEAKGVNVAAPPCDITDFIKLSNILETYSLNMPPIKGCIQAAMVLRDRYFADMNHSEWKESLAPKVIGSWNLHSLLPTGMDFFIFFSSICSVIGGVAQANYATGNAFMDSLARHRVAVGEKAISLNLGMMLSEGVVAENEKMMRALESRGYYIPVTQRDFYTLLDKYCDSRLPIPDSDDAQVICGIETPLRIRIKGHQEPSWMKQPLFEEMWSMGLDDEKLSPEGQALSKNYANFQSMFKQASSLDEAGSIVSEELAQKLSRSLMIPVTDIDPGKALHFYGVDSLVAVELRNWFAKELHADIAIFEILGNRGCDDLGAWVASRNGFKKFGI